LEVQLQRDQGETLALDGSNQTTDFPLVEQQFSAAGRFVIDVTAAFVRLDVGIQQEDLAVANDAVGIGNARLSRPQRLHLSSAQHDTGLERLEEVIVETSALVP